MHREPRGILIPIQRQKQEQKQEQQQTIVCDREHRDGCTKLSESKERWTNLRHFSR